MVQQIRVCVVSSVSSLLSSFVGSSAFLGKNFTFDGRLSFPITSHILSSCHHCGSPCDTHVNCTHLTCHALFLQCQTCSIKTQTTCSRECKERKKEKKKKMMRALNLIAGSGEGEMGEESEKEELDLPALYPLYTVSSYDAPAFASASSSSSSASSSSSSSSSSPSSSPLPRSNQRNQPGTTPFLRPKIGLAAITPVTTSTTVKLMRNDMMEEPQRMRQMHSMQMRARASEGVVTVEIAAEENQGQQDVSSVSSSTRSRSRRFRSGPPSHSYASAHSLALPSSSLLALIHSSTLLAFPTRSHLSTSSLQAGLLYQLILLSQSKRVLELGTFTGCGTVAMADGVERVRREEGEEEERVIVSCDIDEKALGIAREVISKHPFRKNVHLVKCTAKELLEQIATSQHSSSSSLSPSSPPSSSPLSHLPPSTLSSSFDFIYLDCNKLDYLLYYHYIINHNLLSKNGILLVDNTLWKGSLRMKEEEEVEEVGEVGEGEEEGGGVGKGERFVLRVRDAMDEFNRYLMQDERVIQTLLPIRDGLTIIQHNPSYRPQQPTCSTASSSSSSSNSSSSPFLSRSFHSSRPSLSTPSPPRPPSFRSTKPPSSSGSTTGSDHNKNQQNENNGDGSSGSSGSSSSSSSSSDWTKGESWKGWWTPERRAVLKTLSVAIPVMIGCLTVLIPRYLEWERQQLLRDRAIAQAEVEAELNRIEHDPNRSKELAQAVNEFEQDE